ncbi:MAG TPA: hypothetical protein VFE65_13815 [Pseudonocardia sp.]|jgi:hypothetical protein|nr:hypothetical protein [Pseudonocardia sp.]
MTDVHPNTEAGSQTTVTEHPRTTSTHEDATRRHEDTAPRREDSAVSPSSGSAAPEHGHGSLSDNAPAANGGQATVHPGQTVHEGERAHRDQSAHERETARPGQPVGAARDGGSGIGPDRARELRQRWSEVKGEFVDNPRNAASKARDVAAEVLDELERALRTQHGALGQALGSDPKTEELRLAINRYQEFSERLMSF